MAKHNISEVKRILRHTFADFQFYTKHLRARKLEDLDKKILDCLEAKAAAEAKLHQGLTEVNRKKLLDAVMFTRLDIRMTIYSSSENGNSLPGCGNIELRETVVTRRVHRYTSNDGFIREWSRELV